jgi:hypothetical protein
MCKGTKPESKCNHMNHAIKVHKSSQKQPRIGGLNLLSNKCIKRVSKLKVRGQGSTHQDMTYILKHVQKDWFQHSKEVAQVPHAKQASK